MTTYFQLQFKMLNRRLIDFGLALLIAYTLIPFIFVLVSNYLFSKTDYASYIYILIAWSFVSKLNETARNDFLKSIFDKKKYFKLRIIENLIYATPFVLFTIYKQEFLATLILIISTLFLAIFNFNTRLNFTIPTPFGKKPFEFTVGFRDTFFVFPFAYLLAFIAVKVGNFNLGIFAILVISLVCCSYYSKIENEYYVWNFSLSPKEFLLEKIKIALFNFTILVLPIIILLSLFFFDQVDFIIGSILLCYAYLVMIIYAKYVSFPYNKNLTHGLIIASTFIFPPIILIVIPFFYFQSIKRLNTILE